MILILFIHKTNRDGELKFHIVFVTAWKSKIRTTQIECARMQSCGRIRMPFFSYLDSYTKTIYIQLWMHITNGNICFIKTHTNCFMTYFSWSLRTIIQATRDNNYQTKILSTFLVEQIAATKHK